MANPYFDVAVIVGSLRKDSLNRKMARALMENAPASLHCRFVEIGDLPLYNQDIEGQVPAWDRFRGEIAAFDAIVFVTPEYNRSIPGCLKNAIDVGSRPLANNAWYGKPGGVVSATPSALGGFGANNILRQSMVALNVPMMPQPEAYISKAADLFDQSGALTVESTRDFLKKFMSAFEQWVAKFAQPRS
jgi:chromate reductase